MRRVSRQATMQSLETESLAVVIFKFEDEVLRHLRQNHFLQKCPSIVCSLSHKMKTMGDVIHGLRAHFAIPVPIKLKTYGGFFLPDLPVKALTFFSDPVRVDLYLGEYTTVTTGRTSNDGEDVVPHPPPPAESNEEQGQESIVAITDHPDSRMSQSEADKEKSDKEKKELGRKVSIPGRHKITCLRRRRQSEGKNWMAPVQTRQNTFTGTGTGFNRNLQSSRMNPSSDTSGTRSFPGCYYCDSSESYGLRRLKRVAADPNLHDIAKGKRKLSTPSSQRTPSAGPPPTKKSSFRRSSG